MAELHAMTSYPIKGCAGVPLHSAWLGPPGLPEDRAFLVVNEQGTYRTSRHHPRLALVHPRTHDGWLTVCADGMPELTIAIEEQRKPVGITLFGDAFTGVDQGERIARWFSELLGVPSRLVRVPADHDRFVAGWTSGTSNYADSCAVHLLSSASLAGLAERMREPVADDRFRANLIVTGLFEHEEDTLRVCRIGTAELGYAKPAIRCVVTTVDNTTGSKHGPEPLRTLATYRRTAEGIAFGVKLAVRTPGWLTVGEELVMATSEALDVSECGGLPR